MQQYSQQHQLIVPLSRLVPGRRNPRKVKPAREAHRRLVALIRAHGLLQPLVVRPDEEKPKHYRVIAGSRRLAALREIHRDNGDPKIPCVLRDVDAVTADALSLGENFGREAMHPLDEAEAFAKLASQDGKGAEAIAAEFGVTPHYVRQRMKLATLADMVKAAYREGGIDTGTAEAFAAVPPERQQIVWQEVGGHPRHAEHVKNVIANEWIEAGHALFDVSVLPESVISRDLFGDRVLVERQAFIEAQSQALGTQRQELVEEGWSEVVAGRWEDVQDRLVSMVAPEREFDPETQSRLDKLVTRGQKLDAKAEEIGDGDEAAINTLVKKRDALEAEAQEIVKQAPLHFSEETKSVATAFLLLGPDGQVRREYRVPRRRQPIASGNGIASDGTGGGSVGDRPKPPTSEDLSDSQLAVTYTHQALAVREAVLKHAAARKRVLALILHEKVRSETLSVRHEPNSTTLHANHAEKFTSPAFDRLREKRSKIDPFADTHHVEDREGYVQLGKLSDAKVDALIDSLIVDCITTHTKRGTELVQHLSDELKVDVRRYWRPEAVWLSGYQKIQLTHLIAELKGTMHTPAPERKKSELVAVLEKLFADAAAGTLEDKTLAERVNRWLPRNLRETLTA